MKRTLIKPLLLVFITICILFIGCACHNDDENSNTIDDEYPEQGVLEKFKNRGYSSLAKLKVLSIYDGYYQVNGAPAWILDCQVENDYYGIREAGEKVTLAICKQYAIAGRISKGDGFSDYISYELFPDESLHKLIESGYILAHLGAAAPSVGGDFNGLFDGKDLCISIITDYRVMPIKDGKLSVTTVDDILNNVRYPIDKDYKNDLLSYFSDGMTEDEIRASATVLEMNIAQLYDEDSRLAGKKSCEVLSIEQNSGDLTLEVKSIDPYLNHIIITVKNNTDRRIKASVYRIPEKEGEWDHSNWLGVRFLAHGDIKAGIGIVDLKPNEEKEYKLDTRHPFLSYGKYKIYLQSQESFLDPERLLPEVILEVKKQIEQ